MRTEPHVSTGRSDGISSLTVTKQWLFTELIQKYVTSPKAANFSRRAGRVKGLTRFDTHTDVEGGGLLSDSLACIAVPFVAVSSRSLRSAVASDCTALPLMLKDLPSDEGERSEFADDGILAELPFILRDFGLLATASGAT